MNTQERRSCRRYRLNYPVVVASLPEGEGHLAEICDAGIHGMRLMLTDPAAVPVGATVRLVCSPARPVDRQTGQGIDISCRIAWQDPNNLEVGLQYC